MNRLSRITFAVSILVVTAFAPGSAFAAAPTVVSSIPDTTVVEDNAPLAAYRDLNDVFFDAEDGSALAFTIAGNSNPALVNAVVGADSVLDISFVANAFGTAEIVIRATDLEALFVEDTLTVVVSPVNDDPRVASAIPDTLVYVDSAPVENYVDLNDVFSDVEDESDLTFSVFNNDAPGVVNVSIDPDSALDLSFTPDMHALATIVIRAADSGGLYVDETFVVRVHRTQWVINADGSGHEPTIEATVNLALDGDTLTLTDGTFTGPGNRGIILDNKNIVITSENGPDATIIDLEGADRAFTMNNASPAAVLSNIAIMNGNQNQGSCIKMSNGSPVLSNLLLMGNTAENDGGAIYMDAGSSPTITGCRIIGNSATVGGGIYASSSMPLIENCSIVENSASGGGAGIHLRVSSDATITNSIIAFNLQGPGIQCDSGSNPTVSCTNIFGNEGGDAICGTDLGNNLSADPLFCGALGSGDIYIEQYSPCAPANSPCGTQIGALPVGCASGPVLVDAAGTLYPPVSFADTPDLVLHVGIDNSSSVGVMLDPASTVIFSDSTNTFTATLANKTYIPGDARNFTATFAAAAVPSGMTAPADYDLKLMFTGVDDSSEAYVDTILTTGRNSILVDTPKIVISALPLDAVTASPGDIGVAVLTLDFQNGYGTDRFLDSLTVTNLTSGPGTPEQLDGNAARLSLMNDVDGNRLLSPPDTLLAETTFASNAAVFALAGGWRVPGSGGGTVIVAADIDSLSARDPDRIDAAVVSPQDVVFQGTTQTNEDFSPLYPLDSFGYVTVDGMAAHQVSFTPTVADTLASGLTDVWVMTLVVPANGYEADTLLSVSIADFSGNLAPTDLEAIRLYRDNGDAVFDPAADTAVGVLVYSGDRYQISGLNEPVDGASRLFITVDVDAAVVNGHHFQPGIPVDGIVVRSSNDGPVEKPVISTKTFAFKNAETIEITNLPLPSVAPGRGDVGTPLLYLELRNNSLQTVSLDTVAVANTSRGAGAQNELDDTFAAIRIYHDDGDGIVDGGDELLADNLHFTSGTLIAASLNHTLEIGETHRLLVTADIDSFCAADGDTLALSILSADGVKTTPSFPPSGALPVSTPVDLVVNGMKARELAVYSSIDSLIVTGGTDILVLHAGIPANGYRADTLETLIVRNVGTASREHFARLALYADGGNGVFDAGAGDDTYLGDMIENPAEPGGRSFVINGLSRILDAPCGNRADFFLAADIRPDYLVAGTIQMSIPLMGVGVTSGNDGPIDTDIVEGSIMMIPKPDQLTVFPYPVGDQVLYPGSRNHLNFGVGLFNGYSYSLELDRLKLYQVGSISSVEIDSVFAYADVDSNGLFDPAIDARIAAIKPDGASYQFESLGQSLNPAEVSYVFVAFDVPLAVTDSATFDLRLFDASDIGVLPSGTEVEGDFPINSPGVDAIDGMIAGQIALGNVPSYSASPNNTDVLAMSFVIPANGIWSDRLKYVTIENLGTAVPGVDISELRLWKEAGGHPAKFDRGLEAPLAYLSWTGSSWRNTFPSNEPIPTAGLRVHVTFSVSAAPNDGATFQARLPIGGIEVESSNDGPVDAEIVNPSQQTISTDPLITTLETDRLAYSTGQTITLSMITRNEGVDTLYGVHPSLISTTGDGGAAMQSGPDPVVVDLIPGADTTIVWTFSADTAGGLEFCGSAYSADSTDVSSAACAPAVTILNRTTGINVALANRAPASANRSQREVDLFALTIDYTNGDTLSAPLLLEGLTINFDDGSGTPVPANGFVSGIVFTDPSGTDYSFPTGDSTGASLSLDTADPLAIQPGNLYTLELSADVSGAAALSTFRVGVAGPGMIKLIDANDEGPVPLSSADSFPWTTTTINVNSSAESLLVSSDSGERITANTGQENLSVFSVDLLNPGTRSTAREILTDIRLAFFDTTGTKIDPTAVAARLRIGAGSTTLFDDEPAEIEGNLMTAALATPLILSPGVLQTIDIFVDARNYPSAPGFYMALVNAGALVARDINSGALVAVSAANPTTNDFPIVSNRVVFQLPATAVNAVHVNRLPGAVLPGLTSVPVMSLFIGHSDSGSTSSVLVDSLNFQFVDTDGAPFYPGHAFVSMRVMHGTRAVATLTALGNTAPNVECRLNPPVVVTPASAETLDVFVDIASLFTPADVEVRLEQSDVIVRDVNDGRRVFGIEGQFPFVSGPVTLQLPTESAEAELASRIPANIRANEADVPAFDLTLINDNAGGHTAIELDALHVRVENGKGALIDPATVATGARIVTRDSAVVSGVFESNEIVFTVTPGAIVVPAGSSDTFGVHVDFETSMSDETLRLVVDEPSSVEVADGLSGTPVRVTAAARRSFPLTTDWTHILGDDVHSAYTNYPNPFAAGREKTTITYYLDYKSRVTLKLYTVWGKPVATLLDNKTREPGLHQDVTWDGKNGDGDVVTNGVYYLLLDIQGYDGTSTSIKRKVGVVR